MSYLLNRAISGKGLKVILLMAWRRPTLAETKSQLPSALKSLTSVFGMETGVTSSLLLPDLLILSIMFINGNSHNKHYICYSQKSKYYIIIFYTLKTR